MTKTTTTQPIEDDMKPLFAEPIADWYKYFAWKPVSTLDRGWRWFGIVWKRKCQPHSFLLGPMTSFFQYRSTKPETKKGDQNEIR